MRAGTLTVDLQRPGSSAKLVVTCRPLALETTITLQELEHLALYLANEVGLWRDALLEAEAVEHL